MRKLEEGRLDFSKADREIGNGRLWRAKEILQGRLSGADFDDALLERYGRVLLLMGDTLEAGRYLFASGVRKPEYAEAIGLFRSRHQAESSGELLASMPAMVRRRRELLERLVGEAEFAERGYPEHMLAELRSAPPEGTRARAARPGSHLPMLAVGAAVVAIFVAGLFFLARLAVTAFWPASP